MNAEAKQSEESGTLDIANVVAAFSEDQTERITGLTVNRLRYWARTGFFKPAFVEDNPRMPHSRFYSFKDIVALRTLELLRVQNNVPLQHLRKVAEQLSHLKDDLWTKTKLYVVNRRVHIENPETGRAEDVLTGQYLVPIPLKTVIDDTKSDVAQLRRRSKVNQGKIKRDRAIARNAWTIAGTRISVNAVKRLHEDGYSVAEIINEYPDLTPDDVQAALKHEPQKAA